MNRLELLNAMELPFWVSKNSFLMSAPKAMGLKCVAITEIASSSNENMMLEKMLQVLALSNQDRDILRISTLGEHVKKNIQSQVLSFRPQWLLVFGKKMASCLLHRSCETLLWPTTEVWQIEGFQSSIIGIECPGVLMKQPALKKQAFEQLCKVRDALQTT